MDERLFHAALVLFDAGNALHAFDIKKASMLLPKEALYIDASPPHILSDQIVGFQTCIIQKPHKIFPKKREQNSLFSRLIDRKRLSCNSYCIDFGRKDAL